jgi:hypothetical protein
MASFTFPSSGDKGRLPQRLIYADWVKTEELSDMYPGEYSIRDERGRMFL